MPCDDNASVVVIVKIEGMCDSHAEDLKAEIENAADIVIKHHMRKLGGRAERRAVAESPNPGTKH